MDLLFNYGTQRTKKKTSRSLYSCSYLLNHKHCIQYLPANPSTKLAASEAQPSSVSLVSTRGQQLCMYERRPSVSEPSSSMVSTRKLNPLHKNKATALFFKQYHSSDSIGIFKFCMQTVLVDDVKLIHLHGNNLRLIVERTRVYFIVKLNPGVDHCKMLSIWGEFNHPKGGGKGYEKKKKKRSLLLNFSLCLSLHSCCRLEQT